MSRSKISERTSRGRQQFYPSQKKLHAQPSVRNTSFCFLILGVSEEAEAEAQSRSESLFTSKKNETFS